MYNITNEMHLHDLCESYHLTAPLPPSLRYTVSVYWYG